MRRVQLALEVWKQTRAVLPHLDATLNRDHHMTEEIRSLIGPLRIGRHFLPRLPDWYGRDDPISIGDFAKEVVGLSTAPDRALWWRAFMEDYLKRKAISRRDSLSFSSLLDGPDLTVVPEGFLLPKGTLEKALEDQRERKIQVLPDSLDLSVAYRRWRLTMETEKEAKDPPYDPAECARLGLEEEAKSK